MYQQPLALGCAPQVSCDLECHFRQRTATARLPVSELFSIQDKTVIATGITGGIGLEIAKTLAEAGAHIIAIHFYNDPNIETLTKTIRDLDHQCHSFECDVSDSPALHRTFQQI